MIIIPAIDIIDGKPVRLYQGDYSKKEVVADSVLDSAVRFENLGAEYLHLVDLDGAKAGHPVNQDLIVKTAASLHIPVEVGGGIRTMQDIEFYLNSGLDRVILGTSALRDPKLVKEAAARYGKRIAVGIDAKDGMVCVEGWEQSSEKNYIDFAGELEELGIGTIIFTDISRDGTMSGPNLEQLEKLAEACSLNIVASGGIRDLKNIEDLTDLDLYGAITGKAMYAGTLDLRKAIQTGKNGRNGSGKESGC